MAQLDGSGTAPVAPVSDTSASRAKSGSPEPIDAICRRLLLPSQVKPDPLKAVSSATDRVAARVAAVLNDATSVQAYKDLFDLRSTFVHGRAGLQKVSTKQRVMARSLARGVSRGLIDLALKGPRPRADVLSDLLTRGAPYL